MNSKRGYLIIFLLIFFVLAFPYQSFAYNNLIKGPLSSTVYFLDKDNVKHIFPNKTTFTSWFGNNFSQILTLPQKVIISLPLGKNVTVRPGKLVKFENNPLIYAVERGGVLRAYRDPTAYGKIYGSEWYQEIISLPEISFNDYTVGTPLATYEVVDGAVLQVQNDQNYYWKSGGILQPFSSLADVKLNGFTAQDILQTDFSYFKRQISLTGKVPKIFDLAAKPWQKTADCANKSLKVAIVFVYRNLITNEQTKTLNNIQRRLASDFSLVTRGLAELEVSPEIIYLPWRQEFITVNSSGEKILSSEVANVFYEKYPDKFDFLIFYNNFLPVNKVMAFYQAVSNDILGINRPQFSLAEFYGSAGKLKGILNLGNLNSYGSDKEGLVSAINSILHELLHHWSGRATFLEAPGQASKALLAADEVHWSDYANFTSPLGGFLWQDNGNGTFTKIQVLQKNTPWQIAEFSDLDLYLLGLLHPAEVKPLSFLEPSSVPESSHTVEAKLRQVTIKQIINSLGPWQCAL